MRRGRPSRACSNSRRVGFACSEAPAPSRVWSNTFAGARCATSLWWPSAGGSRQSVCSGTCALLSSDVSVLAVERSHLPTPADHMLASGADYKAASGPTVRQGRRSVVRDRQMDTDGAHRGGGARPHERECRPVQLVHTDGHQAVSRRRRQSRADDGVGAHLEPQHCEAGRQLRRDLRPQRRRQISWRSNAALNGLWTKGGLMYAVPLR